jgi:GntR family transcriptional regulator
MESSAARAHFRREAPLQNTPRRTHDQLRGAIRSGIIGLDDQLVEDTLTAYFSTSRNSVREALQSLAEEGLVSRERGRGTSVIGAITQLPLDNAVPADANGATPHSGGALVHRIEEMRYIPSNPALRERLDTDSEEVLLIEHVAMLNGPLYVGTTYMCPADGPGDELIEKISRTHARPGSLENAMQVAYGTSVGRVSTTIEAVSCDSRTAKLLEIPERSPLILRERLICDVDGRPRSLSYSQFRADRVALSAVSFGDDATAPSVIALSDPSGADSADPPQT